jgi:Peptidase S46
MHSRFFRVAAVALAAFLSVSFIPVRVLSDEGMFLPDALSRLPLDKLKKRGLKIPLTDIYNPNGVSIKDAVVIVDGGTGEFVSADGLLLTNHHVAFDALVSASDPSKDYAANGYKANSRTEELPAKGYTVTITQDLKDVTGEVLATVTVSMSPAERASMIAQKSRQMEMAGANDDEGISVRVLPMNDGLAYYKFTYLNLRDVRIVYAPPKNIGFFGGDPDNFEWPRHDGDFTFMRAYVGPNGKPADYSSNNVAYKPKKFLPLSMSGVREGDFTMVMGYPGSTRRYRESYSVAYNQDTFLPFFIDFLLNQIAILQNIGKSDPALRIKLQSNIFELSNTEKAFEGSVLAMRRAGIVDKKRADEAAFSKWVAVDPKRQAKYGNALPELQKAYDELVKTAQRDLVVGQLSQASGLIEIAVLAQMVAADKEKPEGERNPALGAEGLQRIQGRIASILADRNAAIERETLVYLLGKADELPAGQRIDFLDRHFVNLKGDERRRAEEEYARALAESKQFATGESVAALFSMTSAQLSGLHEPLLEFASEIDKLARQMRPRTQSFNSTVTRWRPLLIEGMSEMKGTTPYPDANRTLRFTFGEVKGYVPHDAAVYQPFTNLSGVIEKDTGREPFDVPEKLKQLYKVHDFGPYATPDGSNVPVDFLSDTDIIGGNSGSPIMNGRGEQVGIIFDGNYEGLGNDFFYNQAKGRAIAVDIRYVLFVTDKFGGAGYILKELDLRGLAKTRAASATGSKEADELTRARRFKLSIVRVCSF